MKESFRRKNEIGIEIEYDIVGYYKEGGKVYCIYTDFVPENNNIGIRLFVDEKINDESIRLAKDDEQKIISKFNKSILENK